MMIDDDDNDDVDGDRDDDGFPEYSAQFVT